MRTIKLVVIGDSSVGKTSLRSSYVSGRFSTGYRATIGTDFVTRTLPHHSIPEETVTLQIWDTAGQERFSSLATAFFRGADAVLMVYDVTRPETLQNLRKWWREFEERAPVPEEAASDYCCVVVGNKIDLLEDLDESDRRKLVLENEARIFLENLIPVPPTPASPPPAVTLQPSSPPNLPAASLNAVSHGTEHPSHVENGSSPVSPPGDDEVSLQYRPIDIRSSTRGQRNLSRATSRSRFVGTMSTTHTGLSVYHTPSSSLFEEYVTAPSSLAGSQLNRSPSPSSSHGRAPTTSSSSETITPSLFTRPSRTSTIPMPVLLDRGPKLFLTSAKSGHSVSLVFEYIAKRVVRRWDWEDSIRDATPEHTEHLDGMNPALLQLHQSRHHNRRGTCCS